jgi:hypothetical protein
MEFIEARIWIVPGSLGNHNPDCCGEIIGAECDSKPFH